ncbi:MAG TPA: hypothetical protein VNJ04_15155 [Gemmatimonadaceae bacterium]|nr:hypothetical protein [Gemmatimonadaceae bacterium]
MNAIVMTDEDFPAFLRLNVRASSEPSLWLALVTGLVAMAVASVAQPFAWPIFASLGGCVASFGAWGMADRGLRDETNTRITTRALGILRTASALAGAAAGAMVMLTSLRVAIGTWFT